jgi:hypothetical protein
MDLASDFSECYYVHGSAKTQTKAGHIRMQKYSIAVISIELIGKKLVTTCHGSILLREKIFICAAPRLFSCGAMRFGKRVLSFRVLRADTLPCFNSVPGAC